MRVINVRGLCETRPRSGRVSQKKMKKRRVSRKKVKPVPSKFKWPPNEPPHRFEAQLVAKHGMCCINDMIMFSISLDKAFKAWCDAHVVLRGVLVYSKATTSADTCVHFALKGTYSVRPEVVQLHRDQWVHIYHTSADRDNTHQLSILQLASTFCISQPDHFPECGSVIPVSVHSQVSYIDDGKLDTEIEKTSDGHYIQVDHSRHTPEMYRFIVKMKW